MLSSFLSVIPILGPIIQGVVDAWGKHEDVTLQKQVDTNKTDVSVIQARSAVAIAFKDDLGSRLNRDLIMFGASMWTFMYFFYLTFHNAIPGMWKIDEAAQSMQFIPYAVIAFLFVTAFRGKP